MDNETKEVCACKYVWNEGYRTGKPFFEQCKQAGVNPIAITVDGNRYIIQALQEVWPDTIVQRCLVHIYITREYCRILRRNTPTQAAKELKNIVIDCLRIKDKKDKGAFNKRYEHWHQQYDKWFHCLQMTDQNFKDISETLTMIDNALANMFHFIKDKILLHQQMK